MEQNPLQSIRYVSCIYTFKHTFKRFQLNAISIKQKRGGTQRRALSYQSEESIVHFPEQESNPQPSRSQPVAVGLYILISQKYMLQHSQVQYKLYLLNCAYSTYESYCYLGISSRQRAHKVFNLLSQTLRTCELGASWARLSPLPAIVTTSP